MIFAAPQPGCAADTAGAATDLGAIYPAKRGRLFACCRLFHNPLGGGSPIACCPLCPRPYPSRRLPAAQLTASDLGAASLVGSADRGCAAISGPGLPDRSHSGAQAVSQHL